MQTMSRQRRMARAVQAWAMKLGWLGQRRSLMCQILLLCVIPLILWFQQKLAGLRQLKRCLVQAVLLSPAIDDPSKVEERILFEYGISKLVRCRSTAARLADAAARTVPEQPIMTRLLGASDTCAALAAVTKQLSVLFAKEILQADARTGRSRGTWYVVGLASLPTVIEKQTNETANNAQKLGVSRSRPEACRTNIQALVVDEQRLLRICKGILLSACTSAEALNPPATSAEVERWRVRAVSLTTAAPIYAPAPGAAPGARHELRWALLQHMATALLSQSSRAVATSSHSPVPLAHSALMISDPSVDLHVMRMQLPVHTPSETDGVADPVPMLTPRCHADAMSQRRCAVHFTLGHAVTTAALSAVSKDKSRDHSCCSTNSCSAPALLYVQPSFTHAQTHAQIQAQTQSHRQAQMCTCVRKTEQGTCPTAPQTRGETHLQTPNELLLPDPIDAAGPHVLRSVVADDLLCDDPASPKGLAQGYGFFAPLSSDEEEEHSAEIAECCGTGAGDPCHDVPLVSTSDASSNSARTCTCIDDQPS